MFYCAIIESSIAYNYIKKLSLLDVWLFFNLIYRPKNRCRSCWDVGIGGTSELASWPKPGEEMPASSRDTPKSGPKINVFYINFHSSDNQVFIILSTAIL